MIVYVGGGGGGGVKGVTLIYTEPLYIHSYRTPGPKPHSPILLSPHNDIHNDKPTCLYSCPHKLLLRN